MIAKYENILTCSLLGGLLPLSCQKPRWLTLLVIPPIYNRRSENGISRPMTVEFIQCCWMVRPCRWNIYVESVVNKIEDMHLLQLKTVCSEDISLMLSTFSGMLCTAVSTEIFEWGYARCLHKWEELRQYQSNYKATRHCRCLIRPSLKYPSSRVPFIPAIAGRSYCLFYWRVKTRGIP